MSYLKHQSREGTGSSGGREEDGEGPPSGTWKTEAAGERAADSGETEAEGGGEEGCRAAEEEAGERESGCKVPIKFPLWPLCGSLSCLLSLTQYMGRYATRPLRQTHSTPSTFVIAPYVYRAAYMSALGRVTSVSVCSLLGRFVEALKAQLKERVSQVKMELPPLCLCAPSFWDAHPETCANNCVFHNNPKGKAGGTAVHAAGGREHR